MTTNQIKAMFRSNENNCQVPLSHIVDIGQHVKVNPNITEDGMDYYYSINILEMSQSTLPEDVLKEMLEYGWTVDKKQQNLVKNC